MSKIPWFPPEWYAVRDAERQDQSTRASSSVSLTRETVEERPRAVVEEEPKKRTEVASNILDIEVKQERSLQTDNLRTSMPEKELLAKRLSELKKKVAEKPEKRKRIQYVPKNSRSQYFTPEELADKRRAAIEAEAVKKIQRDEIVRKKQEEQWIRLGKAICSLSPEDFGIFGTPEGELSDDCTGEEVVANVANFVNNVKKLMGKEGKRTILANTLAFTGALCGVNQKSVIYIDQRVQRNRKIKEEIAMREREAKERMDERWIEIGRAICSFTLEDLGVGVSSSSAVSTNDPENAISSQIAETSEVSDGVDTQLGDIATSILKSLDSLEKQNQVSDETDSEESDEYNEEDDAYDDDEDYGTQPAKRKRKTPKSSLAWRGEDVVANAFDFSTAFRSMMGIQAKHTCFRSPFEFTSMFCNVAEKSVRDRHPNRKIGAKK